MKLKFELVNGYGVLVDEDAEIKDGDWFFLDMTDNNLPNELHQMGSNKKSKTGGINFYHNTAWTNCCSKIIFAEPELKLEGVPVFNWRDFELEKKSLEFLNIQPKENLNSEKEKGLLTGFFYGYKSNPAKYTEYEAIGFYLWARNKYGSVKPIEEGCIVNKTDYKGLFQLYIQSLQKYPNYVVMETEIISLLSTGNHVIKKEHVSRTFKKGFKLFINSEGKQEGIVKGLIWE